MNDKRTSRYPENRFSGKLFFQAQTLYSYSNATTFPRDKAVNQTNHLSVLLALINQKALGRHDRSGSDTTSS